MQQPFGGSYGLEVAFLPTTLLLGLCSGFSLVKEQGGCELFVFYYDSCLFYPRGHLVRVLVRE